MTFWNRFWSVPRGKRTDDGTPIKMMIRVFFHEETMYLGNVIEEQIIYKTRIIYGRIKFLEIFLKSRKTSIAESIEHAVRVDYVGSL